MFIFVFWESKIFWAIGNSLNIELNYGHDFLIWKQEELNKILIFYILSSDYLRVPFLMYYV